MEAWLRGVTSGSLPYVLIRRSTEAPTVSGPGMRYFIRSVGYDKTPEVEVGFAMLTVVIVLLVLTETVFVVANR